MLGEETGQGIERGDQQGDVLERRARQDLSRDPVGRRLDLVLDPGVLLEVHRAIGPGAPRPRRIAEDCRALEEVGCQEIAFARGRRQCRHDLESVRGALAEEGPHPVEKARSERATGENGERRGRNRPDELRLRAGDVSGAGGERRAREGPRRRVRLEGPGRLPKDAGARPRGVGGSVDRAPDRGHVAKTRGRRVRRRGERLQLLRPQPGGFEVADRPGERLVPARSGPEELEGEVAEREAVPEERQQARDAQPLFAWGEPRAGGLQDLGGGGDRREEPGAGQDVGMPDEDQLAPEGVGDALARDEHRAAGQGPLGRQRGDRLGPRACAPEDLEGRAVHRLPSIIRARELLLKTLGVTIVWLTRRGGPIVQKQLAPHARPRLEPVDLHQRAQSQARHLSSGPRITGVPVAVEVRALARRGRVPAERAQRLRALRVQHVSGLQVQITHGLCADSCLPARTRELDEVVLGLVRVEDHEVVIASLLKDPLEHRGDRAGPADRAIARLGRAAALDHRERVHRWRSPLVRFPRAWALGYALCEAPRRSLGRPDRGASRHPVRG